MSASTRWDFAAWMADPCVRACSFAARGLWFDMLCIAGMNKGNDHGFVSVAGKPMDAIDLTRALGGKLTDVAKLLAELEANKVFSRDDHGAIYNRRMVRKAGDPSLLPMALPKVKAQLSLMADDWQPSRGHLDYANEHGFSDAKAQRMAQAFADHHRARGHKMQWDAAWRTWVRNEVTFAARRRGGGGRESRNGMAALAMRLNGLDDGEDR